MQMMNSLSLLTSSSLSDETPASHISSLSIASMMSICSVGVSGRLGGILVTSCIGSSTSALKPLSSLQKTLCLRMQLFNLFTFKC